MATHEQPIATLQFGIGKLEIHSPPVISQSKSEPAYDGPDPELLYDKWITYSDETGEMPVQALGDLLCIARTKGIDLSECVRRNPVETARFLATAFDLGRIIQVHPLFDYVEREYCIRLAECNPILNGSNCEFATLKVDAILERVEQPVRVAVLLHQWNISDPQAKLVTMEARRRDK
mgnify:CR=1 FL=1